MQDLSISSFYTDAVPDAAVWVADGLGTQSYVNIATRQISLCSLGFYTTISVKMTHINNQPKQRSRCSGLETMPMLLDIQQTHHERFDTLKRKMKRKQKKNKFKSTHYPVFIICTGTTRSHRVLAPNKRGQGPRLLTLQMSRYTHTRRLAARLYRGTLDIHSQIRHFDLL